MSKTARYTTFTMIHAPFWIMLLFFVSKHGQVILKCLVPPSIKALYPMQSQATVAHSVRHQTINKTYTSQLLLRVLISNPSNPGPFSVLCSSEIPLKYYGLDLVSLIKLIERSKAKIAEFELKCLMSVS